MSPRNLLGLIPAIYAIVMTLIITCIFTRAFTDIRTNLIDQLYSFDYPRTYVELYFLIIIDSFILIFYSLIFLFKYCQRLKTFRHIKLILILFQLFIYAYSLSKFLVFYEWKNVRNTTSPYQLDRFDCLAIIFIPLLALGGIIIWIVFFRLANIKHTDPERQNLINESTTTRLYTEEADPLIVEGK